MKPAQLLHRLNLLLPRSLALFLGGFGLLNCLGGLRASSFDATLWWLDVRAVSPLLAQPLLLLGALSLVGFGLRPPRSGWGRALTASLAGLLGIVALWNGLEFYLLLGRGSLQSGMPLPFSLLISAALGWIAWRAAAPQPAPVESAPQWLLLQLGAGVALCALAFPLLQMLCFGKTDYRRPADVAVVLGARAYADGRPSDALADRVRTACGLYRQGLVAKLLFSGGPGDGPVHETEAMRRMALKLGVAPEDILLDRDGLNTQATVKNSQRLFAQLHAQRILVVSHFYHLPRIKLAYQRAGWSVYTVPARESYLLRQTPYNMAREVAALWVYYLRPLGA